MNSQFFRSLVAALGLLASGMASASVGFGDPYYTRDEWGGCHLDRGWYLRQRDHGKSPRPPAVPPARASRTRVVDTPMTGFWIYTDTQRFVEFDEYSRTSPREEFHSGQRGDCEITRRDHHNRIYAFRCRGTVSSASCTLGYNTISCQVEPNDINRISPVVQMSPWQQGGLKGFVPTRVRRDVHHD